MKVRKTFVDIVLQAQKFLILTHLRPDGDAISSSIAMYHFLVSLGKNPEDIEVYIPHISKDLTFVDQDNIRSESSTIVNPDLVIIVDCSDYSLVEGIDLLNDFSSTKCVGIDHHEPSGKPIKMECSIVDTNASSCTCIIFREFFEYTCKQKVNSFLRCVAIGILSDTIDLTLNATDECKNILEICSQMGIDAESIRKNLKSVDARTQELADLAIERMELRRGIGCTYILQKDLLPDEYDLKIVNHKAIIQQILDSNFCSTLILLVETNNHTVKGSMRTNKSDICLSSFCEAMVKSNYFSKGGGHEKSAGFTKPIADVTKQSLEAIFETLVVALLGN
jgi:phosphoesterase RecJ-like protein